jgi:hypothetical protein
MPRILLTGHSALLPEIDDCLRRWGAEVLPWQDVQAAAPLAEYDVIVVACGGEAARTWCPGTLNLPWEEVPVILVGGEDDVCQCHRVGQVRLQELGEGGALLRSALEEALPRAASLRCEVEALHGFRDYVQFLRHELRTPVTAARAALQALSRSLAETGDARQISCVEIALRNLERLREAVAWSEDYLSSRTISAEPAWREDSAGELLLAATAELTDDGGLGLVFVGDAAVAPLTSDAALLGTALRQVLRALRYYRAGAAVRLQVERRYAPPFGLDASDPGCEFVLSFQAEVDAAPGSVARTGLVQPGETPQAELARLLDFAVSREVLAVLGARVVLPAAAEDSAPIAELILPSIPAAARLRATLYALQTA